MDISTALKIIKRERKKPLVFSKHFKEKLTERKLGFIFVREAIRKNRILRLVDQGEDKYKVWFHYDSKAL